MAKLVILKSFLFAYNIAIFFLLPMFMMSSLVAIDTNTSISFTIDLIHRDSPQSPIFNSSSSPSQRLHNAIRRSFNRVHYLKSKYSKKTPVANIMLDRGEYLMRYSIGTPSLQALAIADTGSDLIWTQCQRCVQCFKQETPIFNPRSSSTFKEVPCASVACTSAPNSVCGNSGNSCIYSTSYADGSFSKGVIATETLTLGSTLGGSFPLRNIAFGCGFENGGVFLGAESGIVGLGGGRNSLVRQLSNRIGGRFSYCLVSYLSRLTSSKLNFGANALVSGRGVVTTPLVPKFPSTFYYLTLDGISVANRRFDSSKIRRDGNIIIDSGTVVTFLPYRLYNGILGVATTLIRLRRAKDPGGILDLCYFTRQNIQFPDIIFHFRGADVKLGAENSFVRLSKDVLCLAFAPTDDVAVYGNLQQANFLIGYDLNKKTVSFKRKDCSVL